MEKYAIRVTLTLNKMPNKLLLCYCIVRSAILLSVKVDMAFSLLLVLKHARFIPPIFFIYIYIYIQLNVCITGGVVFLSAAHALVLWERCVSHIVSTMLQCMSPWWTDSIHTWLPTYSMSWLIEMASDQIWKTGRNILKVHGGEGKVQKQCHIKPRNLVNANKTRYGIRKKKSVPK